MSNIALLANSPVTMNSREIAELTGKELSNIHRDIRSMLVELYGADHVEKIIPEHYRNRHSEFIRENAGAILEAIAGHDSKGNHQDWRGFAWERDSRGYVTEFRLDYTHTMTLVAGYNVKLRKAIIDRWQELEAKSTAPAPIALSRMDILKLAIESEEARIKAEAERDQAVATKAEIGSRREATAMATAAAAKREVKRLAHELGRNMLHATVTAVEKITKRKFGKQDWRPLRAYCKTNGLTPAEVQDARYGSVKAWPAAAWQDVYDIDLKALFPGGGEA